METVKDTVWFVPFGTQDLVSAYEDHPGLSPIVAAQHFTAALRTVMVAEKLEHFFDGLFREHDILILSSTTLGSKPAIQRVHYYQDDLPLKKVLNNFVADAMYVCEDYSGTDHLWMELRILTVGTDPQERDALTRTFTGLASEAGSVFPITLPYTMAASALASAVDKVLDAVNTTKPVLVCPIAFNPAGHGYPILRAGNYVVFNEEIDAGDYSLATNERLVTRSGGDVGASYAVFTIDAEDAPSPDWVNSQRVATLLTQLDKGNPSATQASIGFVTDTLKAYSNFQNLQRYQELKRKDPATLTPAEKELMNRLAQMPDIKDFLS